MNVFRRFRNYVIINKTIWKKELKLQFAYLFIYLYTLIQFKNKNNNILNGLVEFVWYTNTHTHIK